MKQTQDLKVGDMITPDRGWDCASDTAWLLGQRATYGLVLDVGLNMVRVFFPEHNKVGWVHMTEFVVVARCEK